MLCVRNGIKVIHRSVIVSNNLTSLKNMVKTMYEAGFTYQEIGDIADVSRQRAHQFAVQSAINQQIAAKHAKK